MIRLSTVWIVAALLLVALAPAAAQDAPAPGSVLSADFVTGISLEQATERILDFYPSTNFREASFAVDEYRVTLVTQWLDGTPAELNAHVFIPRAPEPLAFPVYVFGAGTTGLVNECAPTQEDPEVADWGRYRQFLSTYAAQGYIVIMADYAGFSDPDRIQPYYVSDMQGRVALDAARAVFNLYDAEAGWIDRANGQPFSAVFIAGYSQGGQTVFAARDILDDYAPDVPLAGIIAIGSVTDQINHMTTRPEFAAYRWVAWREFYGDDVVDYTPIFNDLFLPSLENDARSMCVRQAFGFYSADPFDVYREPFAEALTNRTLEADYPDIYNLLVQNSPGFTASDVPVLIVQGEFDETIPPDRMAEFLTEFCAIDGNAMTYNEYLSTTHFNAREVSYTDSLDWMAGILSGETPRNDCGDFAG